MYLNRLSSFVIKDLDGVLKSHPTFRALNITESGRLDIYNKIQEDIQALYIQKEVVVPITLNSAGQVSYDGSEREFYYLDETSLEQDRKSVLNYSVVDLALKNLYENFFTAQERLTIYNIASQLIGNLYNQIESDEYQYIFRGGDELLYWRENKNLLLDAYFTYEASGPIENNSSLVFDAYLEYEAKARLESTHSLLLDSYFTYTVGSTLSEYSNNILLDAFVTYTTNAGSALEEEESLLLDAYAEYIVAGTSEEEQKLLLDEYFVYLVE